jgi:uncharacterized protein (DUF58 family)
VRKSERELEDAELPDLVGPELMARVRQIQLRTRRLVNDVLAGAYRSTFRGSGVEFEEVRPYLPGDEVRSIDWNRTARAGAPYVKTYVEERELTLVFLVDTSRSMDFGSRELSKREVAAQFCALLAFVAQRQQDRVGLCLVGEEPGLHLEPRKGAGAVARVVREVIAAPAAHGHADLAAALELQLQTLKRRALLFLVSDFLGDPEALADVLRRVARRHELIAVRVVDPFEQELPAAGILQLEDLESGRRVEVDTRSARVRAAWAAAAEARRKELEGVLVRSKVELIELVTDRSVGEPVARFFNRRRRGGAR